MAAVPRLDIFLWRYLQIHVYQASIPDMHVLRTQITHSTKIVTSHTLQRARAETEYRFKFKFKYINQPDATAPQVYNLTSCVAQHVSGASTPIIRSLQLHEPLGD